MAKDPAFLFYPGDYLRDTQCLSENSQVAYDRIMCEHMRNICISQEQLNFFTKRLTNEEKKEILFLLKQVKDGYQIEWVAESICKRMNYSESRRKNKAGKSKNISSTYDKHMENENENENVNENVNEVKLSKTGFFKNALPEEIKIITETEINNTIVFIKNLLQVNITDTQVNDFYNAFVIQQLEVKEWCRGRGDFIQHFRNWLKNQNFKNANSSKTFRDSKQQSTAIYAGKIAASIAALTSGGETGTGT